MSLFVINWKKYLNSLRAKTVKFCSLLKLKIPKSCLSKNTKLYLHKFDLPITRYMFAIEECELITVLICLGFGCKITLLGHV